jgi:hypothetical protein
VNTVIYFYFLLGLGLVKVGATVVSLCLVDRLGRRTLLLLGIVPILLTRNSVCTGYWLS